MVISAKFESRCRNCDGRIFAGDRVNWERGVKGVSHVNCGPVGEPPVEEPEDLPEPEPKPVEPCYDCGLIHSGPCAPKPKPVLSDPRDPKELCAFLTSLTIDQLQALASIIAHEIERREPSAQAA